MDTIKDNIRRICLAINIIDGAYYNAAKALGVNENMLALFAALDDGETHTQQQISRDWLIPKTTLNSIIKEMVGRGMLTLGDAEHGRERPILLTEAGRVYMKKVLAPVCDAEKKIYAECFGGAEESEAFIEKLESAAENYRRQFQMLKAPAEGDPI